MLKRWLRSVLGGSASAGADGQAVGGWAATDEAAAGLADASSEHSQRARPRDLASVLDDLRRHIGASSRDSLPADAIDTRAHLYDAGYVDSITGADLLVHIERRYGLFIPETDLVGRLCSLDALARHIVSEAP